MTNIETDTRKATCSFQLTDPNVDYQKKLAEFAETNSHLAGYTIEQAPTP